MDSQDPRGAVSAVVSILRRATRFVRLVPFLYVCLYAAYLLVSLILPDNVVCVADSIMCVSPLATGGLLAASRIFGFCRWHRIACLLPSASQVEGCVDTYLVTLTQGEVIGINLCIAVACVAFVSLAIKHFAYGR